MRGTRNLLLEVTWTPKGVDLSKTNTGGIMPPAMKTQVENLRAELKSNGIELGKISSGFRDAYNQGRIMYANWFDLPKNKLKQGESVDQTIEKRRKYLVGLYNDTKATAVHNILAAAYKEDNDGKGGISPDRLTVALNDVEAYLEKNPISNHQGNQAIDVPPNSDLKKFIQSNKSKFAESCLDEKNHLHIKLRKYDGSGVKPKTSTKNVEDELNNLLDKKTKIDDTQSLETQTNKPPSWQKDVFSVIDKLEENQKLNEEVYRIKNLIKKIL